MMDSNLKRLLKKYARINALQIQQKIILAVHKAIMAATKNQSSGVMDFFKAINDTAPKTTAITINITRNVDVIKIDNILASGSPADVALLNSTYGNFGGLKTQLEAYFKENIEAFPVVEAGQKIDYNDFKMSLVFPVATNVTGGSSANEIPTTT